MKAREEWVNKWNRVLGSAITPRERIRMVLNFCDGDESMANQYLGRAEWKGTDLKDPDIFLEILLDRIRYIEEEQKAMIAKEEQ